MALKDILVHADAGPTCEARLRLAGALARRYDARLTALYAVEPPRVSDSFGAADAVYIEPDLMRRLNEGHNAAARAAAARVETVFGAEIARVGVAGDWLVEEGATSAVVIRHARSRDLVVLGQVDPERGSLPGILAPEDVVLSSGRPALIVPYAGRFESVGRRGLIAWNASREAARAIGDALPLLADAEIVTVLSINPPVVADDAEAPASVVRHLALHGIRAETESEVADDISVGDLLLSRAADLGADLIIMGGYGHSRTRELLLGGATRHLLEHMTVPVLMAH